MTKRIAILGCGRIGTVHARTIRNHLDGVEPVLVDVDAGAAQKLATDLGVPSATMDEVWDVSDLAAVAICTPTDQHVDLVIEAARRDLAVFCEKPLSMDLDAVDRADEAVTAAGIPFMVGFHKRFDPTHRATRQAIVDGRVGEIEIVRITTRDPAPPPAEYLRRSGGIFLDMTIHDFDMVRFLVDSSVVEVFARGSVMIDAVFREVDDYDTAIVWLSHASGAMTLIDNSRRSTYGHDQRVEVFGSRGMVKSTNERAHASELFDAAGRHATVVPYHFLERYAEAYREEWRSFWAYVTHGGSSPASLDDARWPVRLGQAARQSARTGLPIAL